MPNFRPFNSDDALAAAAATLSRFWGEPVTIDAAQRLGEETRRNLILRACVTRGGGAQASVIIKATRAVSYDPNAADAYEASGFVKEWAAATYLQRHRSRHAVTPALLASDLALGVLIYEDLGEDLSSLVDPLLHGSADAAERALIAYAVSLAILHATSLGCRDEHAGIVREGFPGAVIPPPAYRWVETVVRAPHALLGGELPEADIEFILRHLTHPGPWQVLVHGDPCPDNVLQAANGQAALIDFEFARPGHALFDAAYWRMAFPTCWCAGTIPVDVMSRVEHAYRTAIATAVPEAADDDAFRRESAIIDCAWLLGSLSWLLQDALAEDRTWGRAKNRSRIMTYLERAIRSAGEADVLPGLCALATTWHHALRHRWPDTVPLSYFPAFSV